ncbi:MAG: hypothetical protein OXC57_09565 [Rhodobacteraceae bacterium]|nr:hypothetical protein [Paracoccaceae bacterium]
MDRLVELGVDINARDDLEQTPLHMIAIEGTPELAELLVSLGSDIRAVDD